MAARLLLEGGINELRLAGFSFPAPHDPGDPEIAAAYRAKRLADRAASFAKQKKGRA